MKKLALVFATLLFAMPAAADEIKIATQREGHKLSQESEPFVRCAMDLIGYPYTIFRVPWKRAQKGTEDGAYDAFFIATRRNKRDDYAVLSKTFYTIKWLYVMKKESVIVPGQPVFASARFAADFGSARLLWLEERHNKGEIHKAVTAVDSSDQVLKMLMTNRIDVGLLNEHRLTASLANLSLDSEKIKTFAVKDVPAGVYFSKRFLAKNEGFMEEFNRAMEKCQILLTP